MSLGLQIVWLLILAMPVACVSWTVTHEDILREPREYCQRRSQHARGFIIRKSLYVFTCEYCLSHYVAIIFLAITRYKLLYVDWRGYLISWLALVWVANFYMGLFGRLRLDIRRERVEIEEIEKDTGEGK
jgi:hypothetical protein